MFLYLHDYANHKDGPHKKKCIPLKTPYEALTLFWVRGQPDKISISLPQSHWRIVRVQGHRIQKLRQLQHIFP